MSLFVLLPVCACIASAAVATTVQHRLRPQHAVQVLTATVIVCALAVMSSLLLLMLGWVARFEWVAAALGLCDALASHPHGSALLGVSAMAGLVWALIGGTRAWARHHGVAQSMPPASGVHIVSATEPIAYAVPGRPGYVVVSSGALDLLDDAERRAMLAHEQAHLDRHHHRFVRIGDVAAGALPPLRPMTRRLRFATERWADEEAARVTGDRAVVARAIIKVALARSGPVPVGSLAMAGTGVPDRVDALLLEGHAGQGSQMSFVVTTVALVTAVAGSIIQVHHLLALVHHICPI